MSPLPAADMDPTTGETGHTAPRAQRADSSSSLAFGRPRRTTVQSDIQEAILHPGNVRINVQGAFIVDEEQPGTPQSEDYEHDPHDIRLPNHTSVVSHIALDVRVFGVSCALQN
jgi:type II pantothenate kinase